MSEVNQILAQYDATAKLHADLGDRLTTVLAELLEAYGLQVHSITSRVKSRESLSRKLTARRYAGLAAVTDVVGSRVITYFPSDVDQVANVIEAEFEIDRENSSDKRQALAPDTFGYLSLHYVAKLSPARMQLSENKRFSDCVFEIQIRSILQHAWAEIEHDLGYKSQGEVPKRIRRRFSQIAGLLEVADEGFDDIREQLREYEQRVQEDVVTQPEKVSIDRASLLSFLTTDDVAIAADLSIAKIFRQDQVEPDAEYAGRMTRQTSFLGLETIADLREAINRHSDLVPLFAALWFSRTFEEEDVPELLEPELLDSLREPEAELEAELFKAGISVFYLAYVMTAEAGRETVERYVDAINLTGPNESPADVATQILETYAKAATA